MLLASAFASLLLQTGARPPLFSGRTAVVLLKDGCPCARECRFALNALADACRGRIRFVGLVDGDARRAAALAREAELRFPILPDPEGATIRALKGRAALELRLVGADGKVAAAWDGLDRANALAFADRVRLLARLPVDLDPALFTALPKVGCAFPP